MHLLISGVLIATNTSLLTTPVVHHATAIMGERFIGDVCTVDPSTLVLFDEHGVIEELTRFHAAEGTGGTPILDVSSIAMAMLEEEEEEEEEITISREVEVGLSFGSGGGKLDITTNGDHRTFDIDAMDHATVSEILEHAGVGDELTLANLMEMISSGDGEAHAQMIVEMVDDDGNRRRGVFKPGKSDAHGGRWMTMDGDADHAWLVDILGDSDGERMFRWESRSGDEHRDHLHPHDRAMLEHLDGVDTHDMMGQHIEFIQMMQHDPERVMAMIEHLPPDIREEHFEVIESMMREGLEMHGPEHAHDRGHERRHDRGHDRDYAREHDRWADRDHDERHERGHEHRDGMNDHEMMAQHMHFMQMMQHDPEGVMAMIEHMPPGMRDEHVEIIESMMHEGWERHEPMHHGDPFMAESNEFVRKLMMSNEVAKVLNNREAVAIFGIWQARAHMDAEDRLVTLMPIAMSEHMTPAVQNAAMWVVMEAQTELGDMAGSRNSLTDLIKRNGRQ